MNMQLILESLAKRRPVFHSEADFQHALAWEIQLSNPGFDIRLEKQVATDNKRVHLDLHVYDAPKNIAVELKYKTKKTSIRHKDEDFHLRSHAAQDLGRYDFLKDIARIESYVESHQGSEGYAILLTNDQTYWTASKRQNTVDSKFRIFEGRVITGELSWHENASLGTTHGRLLPINIRGSYTAIWSEFSTIEQQLFRYLIVKIEARQGEAYAVESGI